MNCCRCGAELRKDIEELAIKEARGAFCDSCLSDLLRPAIDAVASFFSNMTNDSLMKLLDQAVKKNKETEKIDDLIDNVIPQFCDDYCRFPHEILVDFMFDDSAFHETMECSNCPMIKINTFLEGLKDG